MPATYELVTTLPANGYQLAFVDEQDGMVLDDAVPVLGFLLLVQRRPVHRSYKLVPVITQGPVDDEVMNRYVLIRPDGKVEGQLNDSETYASIADYNAQTVRRRGAQVNVLSS